MVFRDRTYSVLMVSASEKFNKSTAELLPVGEFWPVKIVKSVGEARRLLLNGHFDMVLINAPLPDEFGSKFAADLTDMSDSSVMLFVKSELFDELYFKMTDQGVVLISKPTTRQMVTQNLRVLCATRERLVKLQEKQQTVEQRMEEIRIINRAKWKLIDSRGMTENEAHKYIEKRAMDYRITKREVAEEILSQT